SSRTIQSVLKHADNVHVRAQVHLDSVLDRLLAKNFEEYKLYQATEEAEDGSFEMPESGELDQEDTVVLTRPGPWGDVPLPDEVEQAQRAHEQALTMEDFGDEPDRSAT